MPRNDPEGNDRDLKGLLASITHMIRGGSRCSSRSRRVTQNNGVRIATQELFDCFAPLEKLCAVTPLGIFRVSERDSFRVAGVPGVFGGFNFRQRCLFSKGRFNDRLMSCLISFVSVEGMSSLFFIGADRADPMPGKNERQVRSTNFFFFHDGSLQGHARTAKLLGEFHPEGRDN